MDRRSPPLPLTASTRAGLPDTGSRRVNFELVLPPPKFVMRRSAPSRLERYRSSSRGRSSIAAAFFSSHRSCNKPDAVGELAGAEPLESSLDTHDLPIFLEPAVVRRPAIGRHRIESLDGK